MTTTFDVPATEFIYELAKRLQKDNSIVFPEENKYMKMGVDRENPPTNDDWWYVRCASILRKIYTKKIIGVEHLRAEYGGKHDRGSKPYKARSGSGTIVRRAVQQLEKAGFVSKVRGKGRMITPKGRSFMDNVANDVIKNIHNNYPGLEKY